MAAIHHNTNSNRKQAKTADGRAKYEVRYPKFKKGSAVVHAVKEPAKYGIFIFISINNLSRKIQ